VGLIGIQGPSSKIRGFFLSLFYVAGMAVTYAVLGAAAALSGKIFGQMQTTPWTYFIMANLCLVMGLSMLDVFNLSIPVPQKLMQWTGANGKKGFLNSFLIGAVSGVVIGPCTAPPSGFYSVTCGQNKCGSGDEPAVYFRFRDGNAADYRRHVCRDDCRFAANGSMDGKN
jgi:thiol:disulfide interchange protein